MNNSLWDIVSKGCEGVSFSSGISQPWTLGEATPMAMIGDSSPDAERSFIIEYVFLILKAVR